MVSGALERFTSWMSGMLEPQSADTPSYQEQWLPVDTAVPGSMSMYMSSHSRALSVYYYHGTEVTSEELSLCYRNLERHYGPLLARSLLVPFQAHHFGESQDAWLSSDIINRYLRSLESPRITTLDSGYYENSSFIASLSSYERRKTAERLRRADVIFWPVCRDKSNHWYLMVIERLSAQAYTVHVLDTHNDTNAHIEIAEKGKALINQLFSGTARVVNEGQNPTYFMPEQSNNTDCGVSIAYFAYQKSRGEPLNIYQNYRDNKCDFMHFRMHMALTLEAQALAEVIDLENPASRFTPYMGSRRIVDERDAAPSRPAPKSVIRVF